MKPSDLRAYTERDWSLVRELKQRYWAERKRTLTPDATLRIADDLRRHVLALRPDWPDEREREADLKVHARVSECLRRVPSSVRR
ncbi:MAG: hypothetical protein GY835_22455 [bacterium]|nr:hypothetical protein [bacterium]